jgi:hypothetical protein
MGRGELIGENGNGTKEGEKRRRKEKLLGKGKK